MNTINKNDLPQQVTLKPSPKTGKKLSQTHSVKPGQDEFEKVCAEFTSIFVYTLVKNMRSTIPTSSFFPEMQGKKLVNAMTDQKIAEYLSFQNGFNLKELLLKNLNNIYKSEP